MEKKLMQFLKETYIDESYYIFDYCENVNNDALSDKWLENRTSYIYKVGVLTAIDSNKCDWLYVVIGSQRSETSEPEVKGSFYFSEGENDDVGRVINRAFKMITYMHPVFEDAIDNL